MLTDIVKGIIGGVSAAKTPHKNEKRKNMAFLELENMPMLFSSNYLNEMYDLASTKDEYNTILDHLYKFQATEVKTYAEIEQKIIDKYWRG